MTGLNREWGISDEWFAIGDSLIITVLGQVMYTKYNVASSQRVPSISTKN